MRSWQIDLSLAGVVRPPAIRPANRRRQKIARFLGRDGPVERFEFRQTIPYCGYEVEAPPSQLQYGAVMEFFLEPAETRFQASTLLSARDYAELVSRRFKFTASRRLFISLATAAFILGERDLRARVRSWDIKRFNSKMVSRDLSDVANKPLKFAERLVDDMRGVGAQIFG